MYYTLQDGVQQPWYAQPHQSIRNLASGISLHPVTSTATAGVATIGIGIALVATLPVNAPDTATPTGSATIDKPTTALTAEPASVNTPAVDNSSISNSTTAKPTVKTSDLWPNRSIDTVVVEQPVVNDGDVGGRGADEPTAPVPTAPLISDVIIEQPVADPVTDPPADVEGEDGDVTITTPVTVIDLDTRNIL